MPVIVKDFISIQFLINNLCKSSVNISLLNKIVEQDYDSIGKKIMSSLESQVLRSNAEGVIFGLSGGIDSAVVAYLCAKKLKEKSFALIMPDSKISPKEETEDALHIAESLKINHKMIDINPIHSKYLEIMESNKLAEGNLRARIRANILYYYANVKNFLVLGSSDKSELLIGYFTKFGDGSADVLPIVSLYKTQVRGLAKSLEIKESIITKKSSPHLWPGHTAENEIGASYEEIDSVLYCLVDKNMTVDETIRSTNIRKETVERICQLHEKSNHKRILPVKISVELKI